MEHNFSTDTLHFSPNLRKVNAFCKGDLGWQAGNGKCKKEKGNGQCWMGNARRRREMDNAGWEMQEGEGKWTMLDGKCKKVI
jgi:hypothetical protein